MRPQLHPGYVGMFTRDEAPGAIPNGSKIVKTWSEAKDAHPTGATGCVLGSMTVPPDMVVPEFVVKGVRHLYFIEWDGNPKVAVGCIDKKIGPAP